VSDWTESNLSSLTTKIGSGATPRGGQESYIDKGISLIRSQNILDFSFSKKGLVHITDEQAYDLRNVTIEKNDILLNITGDSVARVCLTPEDILPARVNQHVAIIRCDNTKMNYQFLMYYLLNPYHKKLLLKIASDGGTRKALTKFDIESLMIQHPATIDGQMKIAKILSCLDTKIENLKKQNQTLEQMAQTLFKQWFVEFNFPDKNGKPYKDNGGEMVGSELGEIPKNWGTKTVEDIVLNLDNKRIPLSSRQRDDKAGKYPYYGASGIVDFIDEYIFEGDHILFSEDGENLRSRKQPIVFLVGDKFWVNNHAHILRGKKDFYFYFIYLFLSSIDVSHIITGAVQPKINKTNLHSIELAFPDDTVVIEFDRIVTALFNKIKNNKKQIKAVTKTRDTLLPKLMSGKIRVSE